MPKDEKTGGVAEATKSEAAATENPSSDSPGSFGDFDAESIYAALNPADGATPPGDKPDEEKKGEEDSKETEAKNGAETKPEQKAEGGEGSGSDDDLFHTPELDSELAANPALKKRWDEQQAGLKKIYDREKELLPKIELMANYVDELAKPETAPKAIKEILDLTAANTKKSVADLLQAAGFSAQTPAQSSSSSTPPEGDGGAPDEIFKAHRDKFLDDGEYEFANLMGSLILSEVKAALAPLAGDLKSTAAATAAQQTKAQFDRTVDSVAPSVIGHFGKTYGFSVTKEMVGQALEALPQFADRPIEAVQKHFAADLIKHATAKGARPTEKTAPEGLSSDDSRGGKGLDPDEEITAETVYASLLGR